MSKPKEVKINGCSIYFDKLEDLNPSSSTRDSGSTMVKNALNWGNDALESAAKPLVDVLEGIHVAAKQYNPETVECEMKLKISVNGETPVFQVLSVGSTAQISAKFIWKCTD